MKSVNNIFNIPANYHFLNSLHFWLSNNFKKEIPQLRIYLPNHRSCKELKNIFINSKYSGEFPIIKAVSDISFDDILNLKTKKPLDNIHIKSYVEEFFEKKLLNNLETIFFFTKEIEKLTFFSDMPYNQIIKVAIHFQEIFNEIENEEISSQTILNIDDSDISRHRQITLEFLKDFHTQIKNTLAKENLILESSYQNFVIKKLCDFIKEDNVENPIIIAGSTGSIKAGQKLIKTIFNYSNGYVILQGLHKDLYEKENHSQFFLYQLLKLLAIKKTNVQDIITNENKLSSDSRQQLISLATKPYEKTIDWQKSDLLLHSTELNKDLIENIKIIELKNQCEEAKVIFDIIIKNYQNKKIGIVTNNINLVELLKVNLNNQKIVFNNSYFQNLNSSIFINFLLLITEIKFSKFDSYNLLTLLKHPLCKFSKNKNFIKDFEIEIIRNQRVCEGLEGISEAIKNNQYLNDIFNEFCNLLPKNNKINTLIKSIEAISAQDFYYLISNDIAKTEIFKLFEFLKSINYQFYSIEELKILIAQLNFLETTIDNSNINILSPIEARLLNFDMIILASMNENDFPKNDSSGWIGKQIKRELGIDKSAKKLGQNAFDFCNYMSNSKVVITRSKNINSLELSPSPFLIKLKTILEKNKILLPNYIFKNDNHNLIRFNKINTPCPKPDLELRPKKYSITEIKKLISDPYYIYAKKILQIRELKKIDYEPSYSEFGSFVHKCLEEYVNNKYEINFLEIFKKYFYTKSDQILWYSKFEKIFNNFLDENKELEKLESYTETMISMEIGNILIYGKVDRIIVDNNCSLSLQDKETLHKSYFASLESPSNISMEHNNSLLSIIDYKTGTVPSNKSVLIGKEPQLPIIALIINNSQEFANKNINSLEYWKLSPNKSKFSKSVIDYEKIESIIFKTEIFLRELFDFFNDPENGFIAKKTEIDHEYKNLERIDL